jgi:hypothetical protein
MWSNETDGNLIALDSLDLSVDEPDEPIKLSPAAHLSYYELRKTYMSNARRKSVSLPGENTYRKLRVEGEELDKEHPEHKEALEGFRCAIQLRNFYIDDTFVEQKKTELQESPNFFEDHFPLPTNVFN